MNIIILGGGQVGSTVAEILSGENNDVTVVDQDKTKLKEIEKHLDVRTITGHAAWPRTLFDAGAQDADILIAVTGSDETNLIACQVAHTIFTTPTRIARVRSGEYFKNPLKDAAKDHPDPQNGETKSDLFVKNALPVDLVISPEKLVTDSIGRLIETPGALQVLDFAHGRVRLVGVKAYTGGPLVGHALRELPRHVREGEARVAAIFRGRRAIIPEGDTVIQDNDEVFFVAEKKHIRKFMDELRKRDLPVERVILAGGGKIGRGLATRLADRIDKVRLIECNLDAANRLSEDLDKKILVIHGDAADETLLREEGIDHTDVFCAVTNDDQVNILSAMVAKRMGARRVMALINRPAFVNLVHDEAFDIDIAISPQQITVSSLLAKVRRGEVEAVHSLRRGAAEAIEAVAHSNHGTSKVVGRKVEDIDLPEGTTIDALVRESEDEDNEVIIAHHDTIIEDGDHVILFMTEKERVSEVGRLFQKDPLSL